MATMPPSPPEPLSLAQVKLNLRVDDDADDMLIEGLIVVAREHVEDYTGLVLTPRTITETCQTLGRWIDLASWPLTAITEVRYPVSGVMTALSGALWVASYKRRPVRILPTQFGWGGARLGYGGVLRPATLPVEIDVDAGFATPEDVPQPVKQAMHMLVAHLYSNRSAAEVGPRAAAIEVPFGVSALLRSWRVDKL